MTIVSDDPSWWPTVNSVTIQSYFLVASSTVVVYDWALTFGPELELIWRQRWSLMTVLYLTVRYLAIPSIVVGILIYPPSTSITDAGCAISMIIISWIEVASDTMLGAIIIARLHAMYQRSRKMLVFLIVIFLATQIDIIATLSVAMKVYPVQYEEVVLSGGIRMCFISYPHGSAFLLEMSWILPLMWEALVLCLAVWIAVKHFRELRGTPTGWTVGDCFTILIRSHAFYFASSLALFCLHCILLSPQIMFSTSFSIGFFDGVFILVGFVNTFVLGPRLILGVRAYHAELLANSDGGTGMTSIFFQERIHITTGSDV